jgi:hypothetical protein
MKLKDRLAAWVVVRVLRKTWKRVPAADQLEMTNMLEGHREKLLGIIGAVVLLLTSFGLMDWVKPLKAIGEAIESGNWAAALSAFVAAVLMLMRTFARMKEDRVRKETGGGLGISTGPTVTG